MNEIETSDILKGAVAGFIGGLVASYVMGGYQEFVGKLSNGDSGDDSDKEESEPATVKAAKAISENVFDHKLKKNEQDAAGEAMHYAIGAGSGFIYGAAAEIKPQVTVGAGLPFGAAVWLVADDVVVPALGLSKPPTKYPFSTHAYALSSHFVYGFTTEIVRKIVRRVL